MFHKQNGNALLYVLIAITLLAVLTYTIMGEQRGQQQNQLTESRTKLLASDLISHANSAEIAFKQMEIFGVEADQVLFDLPGTTDYSTNVTRQIYHPSGGGLGVFDNTKYLMSGGNVGWQFQGNANVDWSTSSTTDLLYTFLHIDSSVCTEVNKQLHNNQSIPSSVIDMSTVFIENGADGDFLANQCSNCVGKKSLCISNGSVNGFYNIIGSR